jgi:hypothetical protein
MRYSGSTTSRYGEQSHRGGSSNSEAENLLLAVQGRVFARETNRGLPETRRAYDGLWCQ